MTTTLPAPEPAAYAAPRPPASPAPAIAAERPLPWYRRTWVIIVGAVTAGVLLFGAGMAAGAILSGLARPSIGQFGPSDFPDGGFPGDGNGPPGFQQDGRGPFGQDGTQDGTDQGTEEGTGGI
ncbi:hypothetical protein ACGGZK_05835 [Agromyces sp. MMS24-K17]|uniref:hypothetical protein n=1 Tax=Agromyces sp. MMS24-K17 TaxID=3372850 RepID=UPI0037547014